MVQVYDDSAPAIDPAEARRVANELTNLLRQTDPESAVGQVIRQARRELESLVRSSAIGGEMKAA